MKKLTLLFTILFCCSVFTLAQKDATYQNQQWIQYYNNLKLSKKFILKTDGGYRVKNNFADASQYIARTGIYYKLLPHMQFGIGFANLGGYTNGKLTKYEYRPYQELLINDKYNSFKIQHRLRSEQRFFTSVNTNSFYHRLRYRFLVQIPILKDKKTRKNFKMTLNFADEIFIHTGKEIVYNMFGQNRVMIGTTYNINDNFSATLTYTSEYAANNKPNSYKYSNILWLGIKHNMSLKFKNDENK